MIYDNKLKERFWNKVDIKGEDECWEWQASNDGKGYGRINLSNPKRCFKAHRLSLAMHEDIPMPESTVFACHHCDNPLCVNPKHLFWGSASDNQQDCIKKGRKPKQEQNGEENNAKKLTKNEVIEIKHLINAGFNNCQIAREYGVTHSNISCIKLGKTWKNI